MNEELLSSSDQYLKKSNRTLLIVGIVAAAFRVVLTSELCFSTRLVAHCVVLFRHRLIFQCLLTMCVPFFMLCTTVVVEVTNILF